MTARDGFDRDLRNWLQAAAPTAAPASLHGAIVDRARVARQRPAWRVALGGRGFGGDGTIGRSGLRLAYLLVVLVLVVLALVVALVVGALRSDPIKPSVRNGAIAYSIVKREDLQFYHAHLLSPDGTVAREIGEGRCPTFSKDGTALTYLTGHGPTGELMIAAPDGSSPRVVPGVGDSQYALSPDGSMIAWFRRLTPERYSVDFARAELWVASLAGGPGARIVAAGQDPNEYLAFPVWSPDSRRIAFTSNVFDLTFGVVRTYRSAIHVVGADGSNPLRITTRPELSPPSPFSNERARMSWSPDGRSIAYLGLVDGWRLSSPSPGPFSGPQWPPDVPFDTFVVGADGTGEHRTAGSRAWDRQHAWSPDGSHLAYLTNVAGEESRLVTVPMVAGLVVGQPALGPRATDFVWSPDGATILWLSDLGLGTVDAGFREPPKTLLTAQQGMACPPSWQALRP